MKPQIMHIRECWNCLERFTTYDRQDHYCDLCSYMETTAEWRERANEQIEELVIA
jgi:transcriptional regulator NrdR family protein